MKSIPRLILCALAATRVATSDSQRPIVDTPKDISSVGYNVAIVGAGAAGSSAAYYISKFARENGLDVPVNITIFEANDRIGGRTATIDALNDPRYPVEVGGSIFVKINEILYNATQEFSLSTNSRDSGSTGSAYDLGIWDGDTFVFTLSNDDESSRLRGTLGGWWDIVKLFWKYGLSPIRLRSLQQSVIGRFLRLYHEKFPFADLTEAAKDVDLLSVTSKSGRGLLEEGGIGENFANQIIQASTRVNYAQNLPDFHGLETMVCMSTDGGMSVEGGNWQIFDRMVKESGARINLLSEVTEVQTLEGSSQSIVHYATANDTATQSFDLVILAAPYNTSTLTLSPAPGHKPNRAEYVSLHVTLFSSPFRPDPTYFGLIPDQLNLLPDTVLTTLPSYIDADFLGRGAEGVGPTQFWSLSTLRTINPTLDFHLPPFLSEGHIPLENLELHDDQAPSWPRRATNGQQYLYKIFSPEPLSAEFMIDLFGWRGHPSLPTDLAQNNVSTDTHSSITSLPKDLLTWTHEKHWYSYPYLPPTKEFDCFDIYNCKAADDTRSLAGRLYYTSAIESFISTMETSALSGRNIARLIVDDLIAKARN